MSPADRTIAWFERLGDAIFIRWFPVWWLLLAAGFVALVILWAFGVVR